MYKIFYHNKKCIGECNTIEEAMKKVSKWRSRQCIYLKDEEGKTINLPWKKWKE